MNAEKALDYGLLLMINITLFMEMKSMNSAANTQYKMEAYDMFEEMTRGITRDTIRSLTHLRVEQKVEREPAAKVTGTNRGEATERKPVVKNTQKIYPNDPCPCGSGKKFKQCHGRKLYSLQNRNQNAPTAL